jgi:hypothetical protein
VAITPHCVANATLRKRVSEQTLGLAVRRFLARRFRKLASIDRLGVVLANVPASQS